MESPRILLVVTSATTMAESPDRTGSWLEEVVAPYYAFRDARCEVTVASPLGGNAPMDETSLLPENATASTRRYDADAKAQAVLAHTERLSTIDLTQYDAVFFAGGHGTMEDFPIEPSVKQAVEYFYNAHKTIASVCHGPACFVGAVKPDGTPLIAGHNFTCFTDEEETTIGYKDAVPFLLEAKLVEQGGIARNGKAFATNTVVEGHLITGQNPPSSIPVAEAMIHQLRHKFHTRYAA